MQRLAQNVVRPYFHLGILVLGLALVALSVLPAHPASAEDPPETIFQLADAGIVQSSLAERILAEGSVEAIVQYDDRAITRAAEMTREQRGLQENDSAIRANNVDGFAETKNRVHAESGTGVAVLTSYEQFSVSHVMFESPQALAAFASNPGVRAVYENEKHSAMLAESLPLINQPRAQLSGFGGAGTTVAVLDTGLDYLRPHFGCSEVGVPEATCRIIYAGDYAAEDFLRDTNGHGTNVAAVVSAVAPEAKIIGIDVFDGQYADTSAILVGLNVVAASQAALNIRAVNLSLGTTDFHTSTCASSPFTSAFAALRASGVIPVVASGNSADIALTFTNGIASPACVPGALSVGSVYDSAQGAGSPCAFSPDFATAADKVVCYSQSAPILGMVAPGYEITAAGIPMSGTSQAAPHVAGAVAVLASAAPNQTVDQREASLINSGPLITDSRNGVTKRRLDVCAALASAGEACQAIPLTNDNRSNATVVKSFPVLEREITVGFTTEATDPYPSCAFAPLYQQSASAWWKFSTASSGNFLAYSPNSHYPAAIANDTQIAVYRANGQTLEEVACNDDDFDLLLDFTSFLQTSLDANETYYVAVTGFLNTGGGYLVLNMDYSGTLKADGPASLAWVAQPQSRPSNVDMGTISVETRLANSTRATADTSTSITLSISGGAQLSCDQPLTRTVSAGLATWTGCSVNEPGEEYRVTASASGLASSQSQAFRITDPALDSNCDGVVNNTDALAVLRAIAGFTSGLRPVAPCTGDADGGGLTLTDVRMIRFVAAGLN